MHLFLSRLHFPVTTLGPGHRVGIWFQGCSLHCPGCISTDTWAHGKGKTTVAEVIKLVSPWLAEAEGVTVSGGEPFEQVEALKHLLSAVREEIGQSKDLLVYTGQSWEKIEPYVTAWPGLMDAVISDPFIRSASQTLAWRGSDNQRLHPLTPLGHARYGPWLRALRTDLPKALDVCFDNDSLWVAGIPDAGSMRMIQQALADAGFSSSVSEAHRDNRFSPPIFA